MTHGREWELDGFTEWIEIWERNEPMSAVRGRIRLQVLAWVLSRAVDPYEGAGRDQYDNLWFAEIPGTLHGDEIVGCTFWIYEKDHRVVCSIMSTLPSTAPPAPDWLDAEDDDW